MPVDEGFLPLAVHPQAVEVMPVARKRSPMVEAQTGPSGQGGGRVHEHVRSGVRALNRP